MKKTLLKALSVLLCVLMTAALFGTAALANEKTPFRIVAIGDSTLNGYTLNDYGKYSDANWAPLGNGYLRHWGGLLDYASKKSAPYLMRDYLQELMPEREVTLTSLALEGQRTDEVRKLLDPGFETDDFSPWHISRYNEVFSGVVDGEKKHDGAIDHLIEDRLYPEYNLTQEYTISDFYYDNIKDADLIIFDCCTNNFGTFISGKLQDALAGKQINVYSPADVADKLVPGVKELTKAVMKVVTDTFGSILPEGTVSDLASTFAYALCDMCANYTWDIQKFLAINPDVKIVAVAPVSIMNGLTANFSGMEIDFGNLWATMIGLANTYITSMDPNRSRVYYAALPDGVECFAEAFARGELTWYFRQIAIENCYAAADFTKDERDAMVSANDVLAQYDLHGIGTAEEIAAAEQTLEPFESVFQLFIDCAGVSKLDFDLAFGIIQEKGLEKGTMEVVKKVLSEGKTFNYLDDGEKCMLHVYTRFIVDGIGTHPSENGAYQKFEAIRNAYTKRITAASCADSVGINTGIIAAVGILNTLINPIKEVMNRIFGETSGVPSFVSMILSVVSRVVLKLKSAII